MKTQETSARKMVREHFEESKRDEFERRKRGIGAEASRILDAVALLACVPFRLPLAAAILDGEAALSEAHIALDRLCACGLLVKSEPAGSEKRWRFSDPAFHAYARSEHHHEVALLSRLVPAIRAAAESEFNRSSHEASVELSVIIEHASALLQHGPPEPQWGTLAEWMLYPAHQHLASLGLHDSALRCLAAVEEWWNRLPPPQQESTQWRQERCVLLNHRADLLTQIGEFKGALRSTAEACAIAKTLALDAPSSAAQRQLQALSEKLADLHTANGDTAAAETAYAEMEALSAKLAAATASTSADQQRRTITSLLSLGDAEQRRGHSKSACSAYSEALRLAQKLIPASPNDTYLALSKLGRAQTACDDHAVARDTFAEACRLTERAMEKKGADATWSSRLSAMLSRLGDTHLALGEYKDAIAAYSRDLCVAEKAADTQLDDPNVLRNLSASLLKLGQALGRTGDFKTAREHIERACKLRGDLLAEVPSDVNRKRELLVAYTQAGSLHVAAGSTSEAIAQFQSALKLAEELCTAEPANSARQADRALLREQLALLNA